MATGGRTSTTRAWRVLAGVLLAVSAHGLASCTEAPTGRSAPIGTEAGDAPGATVVDGPAPAPTAPPPSTVGTEAPTTSVPTPTPPTATTTPTTAGPPFTEPVVIGSAVDRLVVRPPGAERDDYRRAAFGGDWDYDPATGCNTRELVLIEESLVPPVVDDRCRSTGGRWRSIYDGVVTTDPADLQIDHFVPLADAWRSGAASWTEDRRDAFANDRTDPRTLVAVTGSTNASKQDDSPDEWLPPDRSSWCAYAADWVEVKARWQLSVSQAEKATLVQVLGGCPAP